MKELLKMEHITKRFGEVYANRNINLSVQEGEVHTLLGENGARKSTLMNILIGLYQPTGGEIYLHGEKVKIESPKAAVRLGIGMVHQHFMLVEAMTVFENIILGSKKNSSIFIDKEQLKKDILVLAQKYGLDVELDKTVTEISVGAQQRVEILKALYRGAEILILDEPTAALTDIEAEGLFAIIRKLTGENKSVIFISHKMREVLAISNRITILRAGETVTTLDKDKTDGIQLANLMIGREMVPSHYRKVTAPGAEVLNLEHVDYQKLHKHSGLNDVSLAPNGFILSHVSHVPEDRNKMGLVGNMTVRENLVLKSTEEKRFSYGCGALLKSKSITEFALSMQKKNDIRCASIEQEVRNLSGGNQQKIILARELENDPELLVAVHPTRGLDIGAARYVHDTMIAARDKGCGILLISADFDEILNLSDRIIVMFEGRVMGIYSGDNPPIEEISLAMAGKGN